MGTVRIAHNIRIFSLLFDSFNGWGVTLVDSLDTMLIMGLYDEFYDSMSVISSMSFALKNVGLTRP